MVVVQGDALNRSRLATVACVALTSNLMWSAAPGNVVLPADTTGLPQESVANASQIVSLDQLPAASSAERRIRHMVPCTMIAFFSLRSTMPMSKKPAYSPAMA